MNLINESGDIAIELPEVEIIAKRPFVITVEMLRKICPDAPKSVDVFIPYLNRFMLHYGIDTPARIAAFIAQVAQESGQFRYVRELASGSAYDTGRKAKNLGNTPQLDGDGKFYKGAGLIQTTGKANFEEQSQKMFGDKRLLKNPELLTVPEYAVQSACLYFADKGLNEVADKPDVPRYVWNGTKRTPFEWITIRINGGLTHIAERKAFWNRAKNVIV